MRILYFSKNKNCTNQVLSYMIEKKIDIAGVVVAEQQAISGSDLESICLKHSVKIFDNQKIYEAIEDRSIGKVDLIISFFYGKLIKESAISLCGGNAINQHCGPLPEYRGTLTYNFAILNRESEYGATVHFLSPNFDTGNIIEVSKFSISEDISVKTLVEKTEATATALLIKTIERIIAGEKLSGYPQAEGNYYSRKKFETAKEVTLNMGADEIKKRIQAFYYPPYEGAYIIIDNEKFYLLDEKHANS